jgi:hypothetical protein
MLPDFPQGSSSRSSQAFQELQWLPAKRLGAGLGHAAGTCPPDPQGTSSSPTPIAPFRWFLGYRETETTDPIPRENFKLESPSLLSTVICSNILPETTYTEDYHQETFSGMTKHLIWYRLSWG